MNSNQGNNDTFSLKSIFEYPPKPAPGKTVADRLRYIRYTYKLTMRELAHRAGLCAPSISQIEHNSNRALSLDNIRKISQAIDVPIWFIGVFETLPEATVSERLIKGRLYRAMNQIEAAKFFGVSEYIYHQWEHGVISQAPWAKKIDAEKINEWCNIFVNTASEK